MVQLVTSFRYNINLNQYSIELVTNDLIYVFTKNRKDILAGSTENADAVLYGIIHSIGIETISRNDPNTSTKRSVRLYVDMKLVVPESNLIEFHSYP